MTGSQGGGDPTPPLALGQVYKRQGGRTAFRFAYRKMRISAHSEGLGELLSFCAPIRWERLYSEPSKTWVELNLNADLINPQSNASQSDTCSKNPNTSRRCAARSLWLMGPLRRWGFANAEEYRIELWKKQIKRGQLQLNSKFTNIFFINSLQIQGCFCYFRVVTLHLLQ